MEVHLMRAFPINDMIVQKNLQELDRLSSAGCAGGEFQLVDALIRATISTIEVLPDGVRSKIRSSSFYVGDTHYRMNNEERVRLWARLAKGLADDLDRLCVDGAINDDDLRNRPKTRGEAIVEVCDLLDVAYDKGDDMMPLALRLASVGEGTAAGADGRALAKLLSRNRIPDMAHYRSEIYRLIHHARLVGGQFHNQKFGP